MRACLARRISFISDFRLTITLHSNLRDHCKEKKLFSLPCSVHQCFCKLRHIFYLYRGTDDFSVAVFASAPTGTGTVVLSDKLTDARPLTECTIPLEEFILPSPVRARYVRLLLKTYHQWGSGIGYFALLEECLSP